MKIVKEDWLKRVEFEEAEEDRISSLPDCLLVEILLRLHSTKKAITTSILSKRWKYVWTLVPTLDFKYDKLDKDLPFDFFSLVEKTLNQCSSQLKLKKFQLNSFYTVQFESQLNSCIRYAINRDVEDLDLSFRYNRLVLDEFFFMSSCFTNLKLENCIYNPVGAISWKNLKSLHITDAKVNEDLIANILSGSPVLETLNLRYCFGFRRVDITSKSVKNFGFFGFIGCGDGVDIIEINAPNILSLTIKKTFYLKRLLLLDVSSLIKAKLNFHIEYLYWRHDKDDKEMLKRLILNLRHVKELTIGKLCSEYVFNLEAEGFILPLNMKKRY